MTILAKTAEHLVESEDGLLTIARYSDGHCLALPGNAETEFKHCLKTHSAERVVATFIRAIGNPNWRPLYKPAMMPR